MIEVSRFGNPVCLTNSPQIVKDYLCSITKTIPDYIGNLSPLAAAQELLLQNPNYDIPFLEVFVYLESQNLLKDFIEAFQEQNPEITLTDYLRLSEISLQEVFTNCFSWQESSQGYDFWEAQNGLFQDYVLRKGKYELAS